jgi:hypothetical protein
MSDPLLVDMLLFVYIYIGIIFVVYNINKYILLLYVYEWQEISNLRHVRAQDNTVAYIVYYLVV